MKARLEDHQEDQDHPDQDPQEVLEEAILVEVAEQLQPLLKELSQEGTELHSLDQGCMAIGHMVATCLLWELPIMTLTIDTITMDKTPTEMGNQ